MALINSNVVDAMGTEKGSGSVVLTLADDWDWENEGQHLLALQAKLNAYFQFVETGQLENVYGKPQQPIIVDVIGRYPIPASGQELLRRASQAASSLGILIRSRHVPDGEQ